MRALLSSAERVPSELWRQTEAILRELVSGKPGVAFLLAGLISAVLVCSSGMRRKWSVAPGFGGLRHLLGAWRLLDFILLLSAIACVVAMGDPRGLRPWQVVTGGLLFVVLFAHALWWSLHGVARPLGLRRMVATLEAMARNRAAYYLILPSLALLAVFCYGPVLSVLWTSLYAYDIGGGATWVGVCNFHQMLGDAVFWKSMRNLGVFTACQVGVWLCAPLLAAELVFHLRREASRYWLRVLFIAPVVVPAIVVYLIWQYLYSDVGPIAMMGHAAGLGDALEGLLSRPQTAIYAVILVGFPFVNGINLMIYYAGLAAIPESLWEASRMDGASALQRFFRLDLPLLARQHKMLLMLGVIGSVQACENVLVMTQGGPGWQTMLPGLYMYRLAMSFNEFGYACAVGVVLFGLVLIVSAGLQRGFRGAEHWSG